MIAIDILWNKKNGVFLNHIQIFWVWHDPLEYREFADMKFGYASLKAASVKAKIHL